MQAGDRQVKGRGRPGTFRGQAGDRQGTGRDTQGTGRGQAGESEGRSRGQAGTSRILPTVYININFTVIEESDQKKIWGSCT